MARKQANGNKRAIEAYDHRGKQRANNPPVGLVTPDADPDAATRKTYVYDPHLDTQLQWVGKTAHAFFEAPTVSLHVHVRVAVKAMDDRGVKSLKMVEAER